MGEWLVEKGIGEQRALRVDAGRVRAALVLWPDTLNPGQVEDARLIARAKGASRGLARFANGEEALVDRLPPDASEGALVRLEVLRAAAPELARRKLARARPTESEPRSAPDLDEWLAERGAKARVVRRFPDERWPDQSWEGIVGLAFARHRSFAGGELWLYPTEAMTLIDIDGELAPPQLAMAACVPLAETIAQLGLSGSIGIDFPTLARREDRKRVDRALQQALSDWDHEATAMNGFGFVQLVARVSLPSILHRAVHQTAGTAARLMMRRAETIEDAGALLLRAHPRVIAECREQWIDQLRRRSGRLVRLESDPDLAIEAAFAQAGPS